MVRGSPQKCQDGVFDFLSQQLSSTMALELSIWEVVPQSSVGGEVITNLRAKVYA